MDKSGSRLLRASLVIVCFGALAGCSLNPVARWDPPGPTDVQSYTLDYAKAYARKARQAYQQAIDQQTMLSTGLSSSLIGLGGVLAALAAYHAHADAIIGAALGGGTAYAIGNWNLSKQRVLIYQAGVEGINCSLRAVSPLDMSASDLRELDASLGQLSQAITATLQAAQVARRELDAATSAGLPDGDNEAIRARDIIANAAAGIIEANRALVSGRQLSSAIHRAGTELVNAVDRIDAAVDKAVLDTLPDLSAVPKVVASLAGFAGGFLPGAGIEQALGKAAAGALVKAPPAGAQGGAFPIKRPDLTSLHDALSKLTDASQTLANLVAKTQGFMAGYDSSKITDALKDCGIPDINFPLRVEPTTVSLTAGTEAARVVVVSGGTRPYVSTLHEGSVDGLTISPAASWGNIEIKASKAMKGAATYNLMVQDVSNPAKTISIPIVVSANGGGGGANTPQVPTLATVKDAIKAKGSIHYKDTDLTIDSSALNQAGDKINVGLSCSPVPPACLDRAAVRDALLSEVPESQSLVASDPKAKDKIVLTGAANCLCAAAGSQSLKVPKKAK